MSTELETDAFDVSVAINLHAEGRLAHATARSVKRAIDAAQVVGLSVEVMAVLDNPDSATVDYVERVLPGVLSGLPLRVLRVENGDAGLSRNDAANAARSPLIAFIDGDNLMSENWLTAAVGVIRKADRDIVVHPEVMLSFEGEDRIWKSVSSTDADFNPFAMAEFNFWDAFCVTTVALLKQIPISSTDPESGFGYEDWHWNCDVLAAGIDHVVAPKTVLFYRIKADSSRLTFHRSAGTLVRPTPFLSDPALPTAILERNSGRRYSPEEEAPEWLRKSSVARRVLGAGARSVLKGGYYALRFVTRAQGLVPVYERIRDTVYDYRHPEGPGGRAYPKGEDPAWLLAEWRAIHEIEPELYPPAEGTQVLKHHNPFPSRATRAYWDLIAKIDGADYLLLVPWMQRGGADRVVAHYARAITELRPDAKIVVLATLKDDNPWAHLLPPSVKFVSVSDDFHLLSYQQQEEILGLALVQLAPPVIHLINSGVGYRVFEKMGRALSQQSKVFMSAFVLDRLATGKRVHYILNGIRRHIDDVSGIFTDSESLIEFFRSTYALPEGKLAVHYQPDERDTSIVPRGAPVFDATRPLRVLWAGRFDRQKRLDVLASVAAAAAAARLPVEFHAYGAPLLEGDETIVKRAAANGVVIHDPYDSASDPFDTADYDVYLLTSEWEGVPLVLLKAGAVGIPTIAASVGGVSEVITEQTGYPVARFDDVAAYLERLREVIADYPDALARASRAHDLVQSRHSWQAFLRTVESETDYLVPAARS